MKIEADAVRRPYDSRVRVFSEVRLHRGVNGALFLRDLADASVWETYIGSGPPSNLVDVAARVGPPSASATVPVDGVSVHALPWFEGPSGLLRGCAAVLTALVRAIRAPRLCVFRLPGSLSLLGAVVARLMRRPYVAEVVGDPVAVLLSGVAGRPGQSLAPVCRWVMRWATAGARAVRYETRETLQGLYPPGPGVWSVAYSSVELGPEDFSSGPRPQEPTVARLLTIGTQDQLYKGHDDLIAAIAILRRNGRPVEAVIVGDGRHHQFLERMAADLGVSDLVSLVGRINDRTDIRRLLRQSDLFCMPSRTEGLPRALIEAMAQGLPAVGTAVGGIPELLDPDVLVAPDNPNALAAMVARLSDDPAARAYAANTNYQRALGYARSAQAELRTNWQEKVFSLLT